MQIQLNPEKPGPDAGGNHAGLLLSSDQEDGLTIFVFSRISVKRKSPQSAHHLDNK
jgi:hypothetical protein